jgi:hypothetical protein
MFETLTCSPIFIIIKSVVVWVVTPYSSIFRVNNKPSKRLAETNDNLSTVPSKRQALYEIHGVTIQKNTIFINTAVITSNETYCTMLWCIAVPFLPKAVSVTSLSCGTVPPRWSSPTATSAPLLRAARPEQLHDKMPADLGVLPSS